MISKESRFHGHNSVSRVKGRTKHGKHLSVRIADGRGKHRSRLAVVVSKKVDNRAVVRNRIRRRIYEAVRTQQLIEGQNKDIIIYAKHAKLSEIPAQTIREELAGLLSDGQ